MRLRNALLLCGLAAAVTLAGCSSSSTSLPGEKVATNAIFTSEYGAVEDNG